MLYIIATPIGNLSDITFRAIEILKSCEYILCEDTRHSSILLKHYDIKKPLKSFHKFNEESRGSVVIEDLRKGSKIGLISDAGTPGIADPGLLLIEACIAEKIPVTAIPGPCALIAALSSSGLDTNHFQFCGFLPKKKGDLKHFLQKALIFHGTSVFYESPNRLIGTLDCLNQLAPKRELCVARELTKHFEEMQRGTAIELKTHWQKSSLKGEIVLMISGQKDLIPQTESFTNLSPIEHVEFLQSSYGLTLQEAILMSAKLRGVSKRLIYNAIHNNKPLK